jgi:formate-dependent nitrite reductase cytochrome c552 subunit
VTDLAKLKELADDDEFVHTNQLDEMGVDRYAADFLSRKEPIPQPLTCVYCNAPWTPEMIEMIELSGHCTSCYDSQRVIDVFCSACTRLVYRKEV